MQLTEAICPTCGKFYTPRNAHQYYCSPGCRASRQPLRERRETPRTFVCAFCGREVTVTEPGDRRTIYCSAQCRYYSSHGWSPRGRMARIIREGR